MRCLPDPLSVVFFRKLRLEHVLDERLQEILREQLMKLRLEALENPLDDFVKIRLGRFGLRRIHLFENRWRGNQERDARESFAIWRRHGWDAFAEIGVHGFISDRCFRSRHKDRRFFLVRRCNEIGGRFAICGLGFAGERERLKRRSVLFAIFVG